jgi:hypothetical protein
MRIWLGFAVLVGTPIFVGTLSDAIKGSNYMSGDKWVGLIVPPALVLFGSVLPKFGRLLGKSDERFILEHIQTRLLHASSSPSQDSRMAQTADDWRNISVTPTMQHNLPDNSFG